MAFLYINSYIFIRPKNKDDEGNLEDTSLIAFLNKITAFVWTYAVIRPGVNALRSPAYPEMIKIVNGEPVEFADYKCESIS